MNISHFSSWRWALVVLTAWLAVNIPSGVVYGQNEKSKAAVVRSLSKMESAGEIRLDQFNTIFGYLTDGVGNEKWRQIKWRHNLWDARIESAKVGKPLFIWAMNGDPLGCV